MSATINLKLWKYRAKKDGSFPVYIRITKNRKSTWQSTDIAIKAKDWDDTKGKVKPSHPNSARLNALLNQLELQYQTDLIDIENGQSTMSVRGIKQKFNGQDAKNFTLTAKEIYTSYKIQGQIASYDKARSIVKKFTTYMHSENFTFQDIDIRLLLRYQAYLIEEKKNKPSSINRELKFIKTVFLYAQRMEYIPLNVNPFINFKFLKAVSERGFLTPAEITQFEQANCEAIPFLEKAKDIALFQYYSGGLRISDALLLKWENIIDGRIYLTIKKTGKQTSHKITDKALLIAAKYKANATSFVFGYFKDDLDLNDPVKVDGEISAKTALINKALKRVGAIGRIEKRISTHLLRHSFATNALQQGMSLDVLQSILKHSNIRETQIYAKVLNYKVDAEIDKLNL